VKRTLFYIAILSLGGCFQRYVDPPPPVEEGSFFVHVVRAPDESFPKVLTWYTGTTLSQEIVLRYNPELAQRPLKVGDRVVIPIELVANANAYGTAPNAGQGKVPNLLMGESGPEPTPPPPPAPEQVKPSPTPAPTSKSPDTLPSLTLETFADDTSPDHPEWSAPGTAAPRQPDGKVQQLQQEIAEKQRELERLQAASPTAAGGDDMPPPGLLEEYAGS
jgi:hypothetical protein